MEPTGRREAPPDDRLRAIRDRDAANRAPDFAWLHPGYVCYLYFGKRNETPAGQFATGRSARPIDGCGFGGSQVRESAMMSEMQVQMVARQMIEKHGFVAIAQAAEKAQDCERKGDAEEAKEWRHIEDAMKAIRGPHQS
jgi:hypothetical protein